MDVVRTVWAFIPGGPEPRPQPDVPETARLRPPDETWNVQGVPSGTVRAAGERLSCEPSRGRVQDSPG